jgi:endonuclease III-like uncharacterized protein
LNQNKIEPIEQQNNIIKQEPNEDCNNNNKKGISSIKIEYDSKDDTKKRIKWEPPNWQTQFERIKKMRSTMDAPVDTMGCEAIGNLDKNLPSNVKRYQILVSLMLSSQTKDEVTAAAMSRLQKLPLNIDTLLNTDTIQLQNLIHPVGFYKVINSVITSQNLLIPMLFFKREKLNT